MDSRKQRLSNVYGSKAAAKQDLMQMLLPTLGAAFLFLAPAFLISVALQIVCVDTSSMQIRDTLTYAQLAEALAVYAAAQLFITMPLYYGMTQFCAWRRAGARVQASVILLCFTSIRLYIRSIWMALIQLLHAILWLIPYLGICLAGAALYQYALPNATGYLIFAEIVIVASIWYAAMLLPYQCGYSLMAERQNMSCWRAVRTAAKSCRGHRTEFFYLMLSFLFWMILSVIFGGLLLIVVCPYFLLALYHLFDRVRGVEIRVSRRPPQSGTDDKT